MYQFIATKERRVRELKQKNVVQDFEGEKKRKIPVMVHWKKLRWKMGTGRVCDEKKSLGE